MVIFHRCLAWPGKFSCRALSSLVNCGFASTRKASHWPDGGNMANWDTIHLGLYWMNNGECSLNIVCISYIYIYICIYIYVYIYICMFILVFTRSSFWMVMGNYGTRRLALEFVSSLMNWAMKNHQLDPARRIDKVIWPSYSNQQTGLYIYIHGYITLYPLFCWGYFIHGIYIYIYICVCVCMICIKLSVWPCMACECEKDIQVPGQMIFKSQGVHADQSPLGQFFTGP